MRDVRAIVTQRGAGCDGRCGVRRIVSAGRNARSVRRSRVVLAPRPWRYVGSNAGNGGKKGRSPGRSRISRKAIARGKPGCLGCTCQIRVRSIYPLHTAMRAQSAPGFPCALCSREGQRNAQPGRKQAAGMRTLGSLKSGKATQPFEPAASQGQRAAALPSRSDRLRHRSSSAPPPRTPNGTPRSCP